MAHETAETVSGSEPPFGVDGLGAAMDDHRLPLKRYAVAGMSSDTATQKVAEVHDTEARLPPLSTRVGTDHAPFRIMTLPLSSTATQNCEVGQDSEVSEPSLSTMPAVLHARPSYVGRAPLPRPVAQESAPPQEMASGPAPGVAAPVMGTAVPHRFAARVTEEPWASTAVQVEDEGHDTSTSADPLATMVGPDHRPATVVLVQAPSITGTHETRATPASEQRLRVPLGPDLIRKRICIGVTWFVAADRGEPDPSGPGVSRRDRDLLRVRGWFAPAFQPGEDLRAALAATPYELTMLNSVVATAKELVGRNQAACCS